MKDKDLNNIAQYICGKSSGFPDSCIYSDDEPEEKAESSNAFFEYNNFENLSKDCFEYSSSESHGAETNIQHFVY